MKTKDFSILTVKSVRHAVTGIGKCIKCERHARIHLVATIIVLIAALLLKVSRSEAVELTIVVGFVWVAEMFNTCIEKIMDFISVEMNAEIGFIKDVSAGAVLVASLAAMIIGLFIFIPRLN